jgi:hypothetical protein
MTLTVMLKTVFPWGLLGLILGAGGNDPSGMLAVFPFKLNG